MKKGAVAAAKASMSKCSKCSANIENNIFCSACGTLQKHNAYDYFSLLNIAPSFNLDLADLDRKYFALQQKLHPDRFVSKDSSQKLLSMQYTADLNTAYTNLKSDLSRAIYILSMNNILIIGDNANVKPSQDILILAMEQRDELQSINNENDLQKFISNLIHEKSALIEKIAENFSENNFSAAAQNTLRLNYLEKILESAKAGRGFS